MILRDRFFRMLASTVIRHPGKVLTGCAIMTIAMILAAGRLGIKTQFAEMMPDDIPQIKEYMSIIEDYGSDATVMITLENPDKDIHLLQTAANDLATRLETIPLERPSNGIPPGLSGKLASLLGKRSSAITYDTVNLVRRIDYKLDKEFTSAHGLIVQKSTDLKNSLDMFSALDLTGLIRNINDNFEREYIDNSENLTTLDGEAQAVQGLEGIRRYLESVERFLDDKDTVSAKTGVADFISGPGYFISPDNTVLLMFLQPSISFNEFDDLMYLGYRIDDTLKTVRKRYPAVSIGRTGAMMLQIDENNALAKDFGWPSIVTLFLILILLVGSFRTWKNPFFSIISLATGIIWTTGILAIVLHYLNMMSAGFGLILIGLGIDFGIHFISGFRDGRELGKSVEDSIYYMYERVGAGVITGALTTSIVFFCLPLTRFEAYSQMGLAMGIGILTVLVAQMLLLPALIVWDNKGYSIMGNFLRSHGLGFIPQWRVGVSRPIRLLYAPVKRILARIFEFRFLFASSSFLTKIPVAITVIIIAILLTGLSIKAGLSMKWEYDMMKLSPQGTLGQLTQNLILDKFEISPDFTMVKADNLKECRVLVDKFKRLGNRTGIIGSVDALSEFIPETTVQQENRKDIADFAQELRRMPLPDTLTSEDCKMLDEELTRLHQNIVEIGEMSIMSYGTDNKIIRKCDRIVGKNDSTSYVLGLAKKISASLSDLSTITAFQRLSASTLKKHLLAMTDTSIVTLDNISEDIRKRYVNPKNNSLLINVYPKGYIWNENNLKKFNEKTGEITQRITGMPVVMQLMLELMVEKGVAASLMGALAVTIFLFIDFRSLRYVLLAILPLVAGTSWMMGLLALTGMKLSIMNFTALPLIIGIGIDDGVHILHRYRIEGRGNIAMVIRFTGRAIILTSLTTMMGFGSMGLASHKGMVAMGMTLFYGVGACFISSAYLLPAIITLSERLTKKTPYSTKIVQSSTKELSC